MKKSLIALAVVGAFSAQAAMADTTIYGAANVSFDSINNGATVGGARGNAVSSNASNIGFKGAEDLGDGLSAVWQIEEAINFTSNGTAGVAATGATNAANTTGTNFTSRNTFAGLSSTSVGTAIIGIHDTPYKMATRGMDLFADTIADNRSIMGTSGFNGGAGPAAGLTNVALGDVRLNNVAAYISPAMGGVTLAVATVTGAAIPQSGAVKGSALSAAALYGAGPLNASLAYQTITFGSVNTGTLYVPPVAADDKAHSWKLGVGYTMDAFAVNAVYEKNGSSGTVLANALDRSSYYLSGKYSLTASDALKAAFTKAGTVGNVANSGAKQYSLGYDHNLSKHTTVYALYTKLSNDSAGVYGLGNADANSSTGSSNGGVGAAPSSFSLGMKHAF